MYKTYIVPPNRCCFLPVRDNTNSLILPQSQMPAFSANKVLAA